MKESRKPTNVQFLYTLNGTFYARTYSNGREKWTSLKTKVKSIARKKLAELLSEHHETQYARQDVEAGSATVGQLVQVYLERQKLRTDLRKSSKEVKRYVVQSILKTWPELAEKLPNRVTEHEVAEWAHRHHADHSATFHNACIDFLRGTFEIAIDRGIIGRNPAAKLVRASVPKTRLELPTSEQFQKIVESVRNTGAGSAKGAADLIQFMAFSGCRISEAGKVRWKDVDEANNRIWIEPGKSGHGRHVPINPAMADLLKRIRDEKRFIRLSPKRFGYVLVNVSCDESLARASQEMGVPKLTHHKLRHYFATRCLESGAPVPTVASWLGHLDGGALLLKTYSHLLDRHSQEMAQKVVF